MGVGINNNTSDIKERIALGVVTFSVPDFNKALIRLLQKDVTLSGQKRTLLNISGLFLHQANVSVSDRQLLLLPARRELLLVRALKGIGLLF